MCIRDSVRGDLAGVLDGDQRYKALMAANALGIVGRQIDGMDTDGEDLSALAAKIRQGNGTPEDHALLLARVRATLAESNPRALR